MFKLCCLFVNSLGRVCRHVAAPLAANEASLRTLCSSAVRLQEAASSSKDATESSRQFSHLPPLPGQDSPLRWAGKKFEELPIVHIKATYNNVLIQLTDCNGQSMVRTSCGTEGFKNRRKATPVAAQTTGISTASKAAAKGVTFVRVVVKGLGPGRVSAIQGLTMGGLEVVSITDNTPVPHNGCRPRKARRM
ncbi:28S ribosomal protein S11, mitochondrial isoform X2 [Dunckerocampus dactyliophorus]|uniref:28S ribosomal protein S11, mitochondrial isoform X2 n=1 Tax=Dunckerocampus dactyliophorus TaxID=161453 RepID=UPI00240691D5|nr:28S ribosomal protein S11, mitochondrial isoform X2 [Dunckerocampus dactyliophorus]